MWSRSAARVELCLVDAGRSVPMARNGDVWQVFAPVGPGTRYAYRAYGDGPRADPDNLLVDPYARMVLGHPPRSVVPAIRAPAPDDRPLVPWSDTVVYEAHVRGLTILNPAVPADLRGTYEGVAHPAMIDHYRRLGVTTVQLMPITAFVDEPHLARRGLRNYWGYNPVAWMAPHPGYARTDDPIADVRRMVRDLHAEGIEVILDVVFNHTADGPTDGPTWSLAGLDDDAYYRRLNGSYVDWSGCGNSPDLSRPPALDLALAALRVWAVDYGVDGFRFDLAPALARNPDRFDRNAPFFEGIAADPDLATLKLVAEPWDLGPDGYQLGNHPSLWAELNGRFRDDVRQFWRGDPVGVDGLATRLAGSSDLFADRSAQASINLITSHDGFTLRDLVSYAHKHNETNGERNRDGSNHELSTNHGVEGPTLDPSIRAARERHRRNLVATMVASMGVPFVSHGDELGKTQRGNNNAYCHDSALSWLNWMINPIDEAFLDFVADALAVRRRLPELRRTEHLRPGDVAWVGPDGAEPAWGDPLAASLGMVHRDTAVLVNRGDPPARFVLGGVWRVALATAPPRVQGGTVLVLGHSICVVERGDDDAAARSGS